MSGSTLVTHVIVGGSLCGLVSWVWIVCTTIEDFVVQRRRRRARAAEAFAEQVVSEYADAYLRDFVSHGDEEADRRRRVRTEAMPLDHLAILRKRSHLMAGDLSSQRRAELDEWMARRGS